QTAEERLLKKAREILCDYRNYSVSKAVNVFEEFLQLYYDYYKLGWFTEPVQWHIEHLITTYITKHYKGDVPANEAKKSLFVTEEESFTVDIIRDLFECAKVFDEAVSDDPQLRELVLTVEKDVALKRRIIDYVFSSDKDTFTFLVRKLKEHSDKFHWKHNNYFATSFVSSKDVLLDLIEVSHFDGTGISAYYSNLIATIAESKRKQLDVKSKVFADIPPHYKNLVSISNSIGSVLIDTRKKNIMLSNSVFDTLLNIVSKATAFSLEDIHLLIPQELRSFIDDPTAYRERFEERRNLFICIQTGFPIVEELIERIDVSTEESIMSWCIHPQTEPYIAEGAVAEEALNKVNLTANIFDSSSEQKSTLHGVVAFYDANDEIVEGVVRVIRSPKNEQLCDGEILVAPATTPDYINAINKCRAIITDWGSQTSHAAIVSRELKKSCIIGTKIASQILKTGQKIRINFSDGSIEVIG
ncbi:MAG: hypothetical protein LBC03_07600, partial [Nitrososphaerota archaeon]|nr:hypothetical protein [Nitrososphaerota archaeon]